ncbi:competence protein ComEC [Kineosphaera limosa]|uniref:Metallo-beta-lactamase domain-containing protein n=1 Tax=Kineosphaera limosa NBRC 100340 TaxID=1184609 RepID=K6X6A1_9MICO|nr:ComEC/Rec2 family competence protein [Kineosphaera limosa]NYE02879.1 competence protein ComEC [Kineosphaera limosa]GAB94309.1 hypothetical protein KILIM_004_01010 [Kineosphaera limosa NBRC 100340]
MTVRDSTRAQLRRAGSTGGGKTGAAKVLDVRLLLAAAVGWAVLVVALGAGWAAESVGLVGLAALSLAAGAALVPVVLHRARRGGSPPLGRTCDAQAAVADLAPAETFRAARVGTRSTVLLAAVGRACGAGRTAAILTGLITGMLCVSAAGQLAVRDAGPLAELAAARAVATVEATIAEDPRLLPVDAERRAPRAMARLVVTAVTARGHTTAVRTSVMLIGPADLADLQWRQRIRLTGRLGPAEPGDRAVAWLAATGSVESVAPAGAMLRLAEHARGRLRQAVAPLPPDPRGLLPGLVIGDRSLTPESLTEDMRITGMTHLTAVSGSNVTVIVGAAVLLSGLLGVRRRWRPLLAGAAIVGFVVLARPDPSVVRAAVMGGVGLLGMTAARRSLGPSALGTAVTVLLVADPWLARSFGFALSTLATFGLLAFARPWGEAMGRWLPGWARPLADATAIPLAAQATCAPVIVLLQGSVPIVGILANLAAAPFVAPATIAGVLAALTAALWLPAGTMCAWLAGMPAWVIALIAHSLAPVPFGTMPWVDGTSGALLLAVVTILALLCAPYALHQARRHPWRAAGAGVLLLALIWPTPRAQPPAQWAFTACDVGQGDALLVATGPGRAVLVDAGPDPSAIRGCLDRMAITALDAIFLTHFHDDHVAGLPGALAGRSVGALYVSPLPDPAYQVRLVGQWAAEAGLTPVAVGAGSHFDFEGVQVAARAPARITAEGSPPNNNSVVLDVRTSRLRLLLLADIEREEAAVLARDLRTDPDPRPVDVVKVAHHGSANLDRTLVREIAAPVAVISVGADNTYGHPAPSAMAAYTQAGATVLRTDRDGDIILSGADPPAPEARTPIFVTRSRG